MKIAIVDTYYPSFLKTLPSLAGGYSEELAKVLAMAFGTSDFYSRNLRALGHECIDIIGNHRELQQQWGRENDFRGASLQAIALQQIETFKPDVVFMQDLSFFDAATLRHLGLKYTLAGQCSCPMPAAENVARFDVLFTSFPHYVDKFKALGVRAEYLPLAFEHTLLDRIPPQERDIDVSFVGGLGASLHWKAGTHAFEALAEAIGERFHWYGYGVERLDRNSPLRKCYRGELFGMDMYRLYGRSKIVVNRHGEVAQGYANNLRMYEATGMGALLVTEEANNMDALFREEDYAGYFDDDSIVSVVEFYLNRYPPLGAGTAQFGQCQTLRNHTYAHRMPIVAEVLKECMVAA